MRYLSIYLSALVSLSSCRASRPGSSQIRDLAAFPKYEVQFLNDLPLAASDADRCQSLGIERENEFLGLRVTLEERRRLSDGTDVPSQDRLGLVPMSLTPPGSDYTHDYLCLLPSANTTDAQIGMEEVEVHEELDPAESWSALSHLDGKCLYYKYSRHDWFTYSYCHNSHIRQFREARHAHPHPPGGYEPTEDSSYNAYTLGQAHPAVDPKRPRVSSPPPRTAVNRPADRSVSFGLGPSTRYLKQRWSDGTPCDKTNRPREVEVQAHCSMLTSDVIYMIKEMAICEYVLIIHSPHLCSLPGFKAENVDVEPAGIRCREVVSDEDWESWRQGGAETLRLPLERPTVEPVPMEPEVTVHDIDDDTLKAMLQRTLEAIGRKTEKGDGKDDVMLVSWEEGEDGTVLLDADLLIAGDEEGAEREKVGGKDREMILKVVQEYLEKKEKEEKRQRDEL